MAYSDYDGMKNVGLISCSFFHGLSPITHHTYSMVSCTAKIYQTRPYYFNIHRIKSTIITEIAKIPAITATMFALSGRLIPYSLPCFGFFLTISSTVFPYCSIASVTPSIYLTLIVRLSTIGRKCNGS